MAKKRSKQHPSMERLQEAARSLDPPVDGGSAIAEWLNVSPQRVTNWGRRSVSREGALSAQKLSGYSANWILTGDGEKLAGDATASTPLPPPTGAKKGAFIKEPDTLDKEMLKHFQHLLASDKRKFIEEAAELAKVRDEDRKEIWKEAGMVEIMARAAHTAKGRSATTTTTPHNKPKVVEPNAPELPDMPDPSGEL